MNHTEFAAAVKAKYPQYADMSDAELTRAMMAKFPTEYADVDTAGMLAPLDTGHTGGAPADNTAAVPKPSKPVANLEYLANQRAAERTSMDEQHPLMPRLAVANDLDTSLYQAPTGAQKVWAGAKDVASMPGRLLTAGVAAIPSVASVPDGEAPWPARALQNYRSDLAKYASAPTDIGNQGGASAFLEGALKDPLNALLPAGSLAKTAALRIPAVAAKAAELAPKLTGAAGVEDAAQAAGSLTERQMQELLARRAEAGTDAAIDAQLESMPHFQNQDGTLGIGLLEGQEGHAAAREGYISAAERGVASEIDPLLRKIQSQAHTSARFPAMSMDRVRQALGTAQHYADATATQMPLPRRAAGAAVRTALPVGNALLRGGALPAVYGSLDEALSGQPISSTSFGANLLGGAAMHGFGSLLKERGTASFPGAEPAVSTNRGPSKSVRATVKNNMDELIGSGLLPTLSQKGYLRTAKDKLRMLGDKYDKAGEQILPSEVFSPDELVALARAKLDADAARGALVYSGAATLDASAPLGLSKPTLQRQFKPEIEAVLERMRNSALGAQHVYATPTNLVPEGTSKKVAKQALKDYNANVKEQLDNPTAPVSALLSLRKEANDPSIYQDPAKELIQGRKRGYEAIHYATNELLNRAQTTSGKTYGELIDEQDLARPYGLWSSFRDVMHSQRAGLQHRLSESFPLIGKYAGNAALSHYTLPSLLYYAGRAAQNTPGLGRSFGSALASTQDTTGAR